MNREDLELEKELLARWAAAQHELLNHQREILERAIALYFDRLCSLEELRHELKMELLKQHKRKTVKKAETV
jgi:hypothetical protein